jgi:hypothetical protein
MTGIRHPEWLTLTVHGHRHLGYDQEWYPQERQRIAGCGPTVGASIVTYIEHKEWKVPVATKEEALRKMLDMWPYATPRLHGLYKSVWLRDGLNHYMADHGLRGKAENLPIPSIRMLAPHAEKVAAFIEEGLKADCPLGFLNLHSGTEPIPYHWHWMLLTAMEKKDNGTHQVTLWDEGQPLKFCLEGWLRSTRFGGGFVRVMETAYTLE